MNQTTDKILEVSDLKIRIKLDEGLLTPVRGVRFFVRAGETLGLVGESGCGKSITCKAILGINGKRCETDGSVAFYDRDGRKQELLAMKPGGKEIRAIRGKQIAMIFQEPMSAFSPLFSIGHQLTETVRLHVTKDRAAAKKIVLDTMAKVGIADPEKRFTQYPHGFSGGMLQRALIAMALSCNPRMLIADEPTTALDVTIQAQILELLGKLQRDSDMAVLYITHDLGTVAQICDRVAVMYLGRIIETAPVHEIFKNPIHPYTRGLMGSVHKIGGRKGRLFSIDGSVPLAMNLTDQCHFYDRCNRRCEGLCRQSEPVLTQVGPDHYVACRQPWLPDRGASSGQDPRAGQMDPGDRLTATG